LKHLKTMNANTRRSILLLVFIGFVLVSFGQSKAELQAQRDELNQRIAYTKKLISETESNQSEALSELKILREQIRYRQQLLSSFEREVKDIQQEIANSDRSIHEMESKIAFMKEEYAAMIYQAYKNQSSKNELMYVFASADFNQAYKRFKIMQEYAEFRKRQANEIRATQESLRARITELENTKDHKEILLTEKSIETEKLAGDKEKSEKVVAQLKQEESKLRKQQQQQEAERQKINAAIKQIIAAELAAEKKKNDGKYELTPEGKVLSERFEQNKGNLPWPVVRGVITSRFGKQPHPTIPGITTENNGIDITTEKAAAVMAIFGGEVTSVFSIPGAGMNIIVTHGAYKTVYTNLSDVSLKKGNQVDAGQKMGNVLHVSGKSIAHIEVWKMTSEGGKPQNAELWISKH
jgi:septal ring factor EnvC (AmiA/AmiB activator)